MLHKLLSVVLSFLLFSYGVILSFPVHAQEKVNLAVLDLDANGVSATEARAISNNMRVQMTRVINSGDVPVNYSVVERSQMDKIFNEFEIQNTGCTDVSCAVDFGKLLNVERISIGSIGLVGDTYILNLSLVDIESARIIDAAEYKAKSSLKLLNDGIPQVVYQILYGKKKKSRTIYYITGDVDNTGSSSTTVTMNSDRTLTAQFSEKGGLPDGLILVSITGGTFEMGDIEGGGDSNEKPVHTVTLSSFDMSIYKVTNGQYASYLSSALESGDITATSSSVKGKTGDYNGEEYLDLDTSYCEIRYSSGSFTVISGKEDHPVIEVTWYGSKAFALYYGLDLPTESEWEYACRGGKQYMYGTDDGTIDSSKANYYGNVGDTTDVGSYPANPFGLYGMSGNVYEWCHDWYGSYSSESATNPTGAQTGSYRVFRGGDWYDNADYCRSAFRHYNFPVNSSSRLGFRVVSRSSPQN